MADINIENFYKHIARILSILYEAFPSKSALYVDDIAGVDDPDEYGLHSPDYTAGFSRCCGSRTSNTSGTWTRSGRMASIRQC